MKTQCVMHVVKRRKHRNIFVECEKLREEGRSWKKIDYETMKYGSLEDKAEAAKLINENLRKLQIFFGGRKHF